MMTTLEEVDSNCPAAAAGFFDVTRLARAYLVELLTGEPVPASIRSDESRPSAVNVTLRTRGAVRGSMTGRGVSLRDQVFDAVTRAALDRRFAGPITAAELDLVTIEVWVQTSVAEIPLKSREKRDALILGEDGVEVEQGSAKAYFKPSVAITSGFDSPQSMFSAVCRKAKLPDDAWKQPDCNLRKTRWIHLVEGPNREEWRFHQLRLQEPSDIDRETIKTWADSGTGYLIANQQVDGHFCYRYNPLTGTAFSEPPNSVRASGCAYALTVAASSGYISDEERARASALKAVDSLLSRAIEWKEGIIVPEKSADGTVSGKLGTTALLAAALSSPIATGKFYDDRRRGLLKSIVAAQDPSGLFSCGFGGEPDRPTQINFFPGQALLALVMGGSDQEGIYRSACERAFRPYRDHFRANPATAFVGWHVDVWSRLAIEDQNDEYASFAFEQVDWLLRFQISEPGVYRGGFSTSRQPPSFSTLVYAEAIVRGLRLAKHVGDQERSRQYRAALDAALEFCNRLHLKAPQSFLFADPSRALGGFVKSIASFEIRSDFVQHAVTLALAILEGD